GGWVAGLWMGPGNRILYASLLLLGGRLPDLFGPRRVLISSLTLLVASIITFGIASSAPLILALAGLLGAAAACSIPAAQAILTTRYDGQDRTKPVAMSTGIGVTGFLAALLATGLLADYSWRLPVLVPESWSWDSPTSSKPHPRPRGLHRDTPQNLRLRPDVEPIPAVAIANRAARSLPQPPDPGDGECSGRLRLPAQRRLLL